jgi:hypothetical protein
MACGGDEENGGVGGGWFYDCGKVKKEIFLHFSVDKRLEIWDDQGTWKFFGGILPERRKL